MDLGWWVSNNMYFFQLDDCKRNFNVLCIWEEEKSFIKYFIFYRKLPFLPVFSKPAVHNWKIPFSIIRSVFWSGSGPGNIWSFHWIPDKILSDLLFWSLKIRQLVQKLWFFYIGSKFLDQTLYFFINMENFLMLPWFLEIGSDKKITFWQKVPNLEGL